MNEFDKKFLQFLADGAGTMCVWTPLGTKIRCVSPESGLDKDVEHSNMYLIIGEAYTVQKIDVYDSISYVWLEEIPGTCFNTVQFENIEPISPEIIAESRIKWEKKRKGNQ